MTQMEELNKLLIKFKLQLKQKGITQQLAAEQLNITRSHLNKVINTDNLIISADQPFKANIDGEALLSDRFEIELVPNRFRIELNKEFIKEVIKK